MIRTSALLAAFALSALSAGFVPGPSARETTETARKAETMTITARIENINKENRTVTLRDPDGHMVTVRVPETFERFSALRVGDTVTARYTEAMALAVGKPGEAAPEPSTEEYASRSDEMPGGVMARRMSEQVTVMDIDHEEGILSVKMPDGSLNTLQVGDKQKLEGLQPGDQINVTYTEALLLSAQPQTPGHEN
jgi:hypothetical protein